MAAAHMCDIALRVKQTLNTTKKPSLMPLLYNLRKTRYQRRQKPV